MGIKVTGLKKLTVALKKCADLGRVKKVVAANGADLQTKMMGEASFKGHYKGSKWVAPSGTTKRSILLDLLDGGMTAEVGPTTHYAMYLEYGTRYMAAQPFALPAYNKQKPIFLKEMAKYMR